MLEGEIIQSLGRAQKVRGLKEITDNRQLTIPREAGSRVTLIQEVVFPKGKGETTGMAVMMMALRLDHRRNDQVMTLPLQQEP